jgi:hypothetical protein
MTANPEASENHEWARKVIQNRKKTNLKTPVSCKFLYFKSAKTKGPSMRRGAARAGRVSVSLLTGGLNWGPH